MSTKTLDGKSVRSVWNIARLVYRERFRGQVFVHDGRTALLALSMLGNESPQAFRVLAELFFACESGQSPEEVEWIARDFKEAESCPAA